MPRPPRDLRTGRTHHITVRCNNRRFNLHKPPCRKVLLFALRRAKEKYAFRLFGLCIMSNHVHYRLKPGEPEDLPKIMHWLNWYTAMCFNRMLNRTGHFWEQRYHAATFPTANHQRALNVLRYIHANPKAAGISSGFGYRYSNYATYEKLTDDQLTEWHPAFLRMGRSLDECAARYRAFCGGCRIQTKAGGRRSFWARKWLPDARTKRTKDKAVPGQLALWERCQVQNAFSLPAEVLEVADRFFRAGFAWP